MRHRAGLVLMAVGTALLVGALSLFAWVRWDESRAAGDVAEVMERVAEAVAAGEATDPEDGYGMEAVEVDGVWYVGYLTVPSLGLELPVASAWSDEQLGETPCRYYGTARAGTLVVAGYNYDAHFGRLGSLAAGDAVYFTCADGTTYEYEVVEVASLGDTSTDEVTSGGFDLTLFTRTQGGSMVLAVRCERV